MGAPEHAKLRRDRAEDERCSPLHQKARLHRDIGPSALSRKLALYFGAWVVKKLQLGSEHYFANQ